jgi:hypothetical protein
MYTQLKSTSHCFSAQIRNRVCKKTQTVFILQCFGLQNELSLVTVVAAIKIRL